MGAKTLKLEVQKLFKFYCHIPQYIEMCRWFSQGATENQNGRHESNPFFFVGAKTLKFKVRNYSNATLTFPTIWRCSVDFLRFRWNSKWPPQINLNFLVGAKTLKLSQKFFKFYILIPHNMEMCRWFFKGFAEIQNGHHGSTSIFCGRKNSKNEVRNNSHFTITLPTICRCASDFTEI